MAGMLRHATFLVKNQVRLTVNPEVILGPLRLSKKRFLCHFLAASRHTIAAHWKQSDPSTLGVFFERLNYVMHMEELTELSDDKSPAFFASWQPWVRFTSSVEYRT